MEFASPTLRSPTFRQKLADALTGRRPAEEVGLASAAGLFVLGTWVGIVTLPTVILGDLGGGY